MKQLMKILAGVGLVLAIGSAPAVLKASIIVDGVVRSSPYGTAGSTKHQDFENGDKIDGAGDVIQGKKVTPGTNAPSNPPITFDISDGWLNLTQSFEVGADHIATVNMTGGTISVSDDGYNNTGFMIHNNGTFNFGGGVVNYNEQAEAEFVINGGFDWPSGSTAVFNWSQDHVSKLQSLASSMTVNGSPATAGNFDITFGGGVTTMALAGGAPPPPALVTPSAALADLNRTGAGNPFPDSGSVGWTIDPWGFPAGDVDLGENPSDLNGSTLAYWYLKPGSQSGALPPKSLYYDLGQAMTVDQIHLWWSDRDAPNITGRVTDMDIDYLPLAAAQPGTFDLATMQGLSGWVNAVAGYDPSAGSFGVQQDLDPADFATRYIRLTMNASGYGGSNGNQWGGLRQIALTEAVPEGEIPEPATVAMLGLAVTGLGAYARKRRRKAMKHLMTILVAMGLVLAVGGVARADLLVDLNGQSGPNQSGYTA